MKKLMVGLAVFGFGIGSAAAAGLEVTLSEPFSRSDYGSGKIHYALTNRTGGKLQVLRWQTPLDGLQGRLFEVTRNGTPVDFQGQMLKRAAPTAADYVDLAPGATLSTEIDLTAYYDMKAGGQYEVRYLRDARDVIREVNQTARGGVTNGYLDFDRKAATSVYVDAAPGAFDELASAARPAAVTGVLAATNSFVGCTNTRQTQIATARIEATTYANNAKSYLDAGTQGSRYTWWFGTVQATRYATVRTNFTNIHNALASQPFTYDCTCSTAGVFASVNPNNAYRINICPAFWDAGMTGTDSKAGTLVHEVSHFTVVAGTDDHAYSQTKAHNLATSNPSRAIDNADSHEYFAENTPARD